MLSAFRKVRKSIINISGFKKYALYAVGEIILVVIGILIALSINNWNENRKERQYELEILSEIYEGLRADSARLVTWWIPRVENKWSGIERMSQYIYEGRLPADSTIRDAYRDMGQTFLISLNMGPFESLKSNGLELISDKELRFLLVDVFESVLPRQIFALSREEEDLHSLEEELDRYFWKESLRKTDGIIKIERSIRSANMLNDELLIHLVSEESDEARRKEGRIKRIKETIDLTLYRLRIYLESNGIDVNQSTIGSVLGVRGMLSDSLEVRRAFK